MSAARRLTLIRRMVLGPLTLVSFGIVLLYAGSGWWAVPGNVLADIGLAFAAVIVGVRAISVLPNERSREQIRRIGLVGFCCFAGTAVANILKQIGIFQGRSAVFYSLAAILFIAGMGAISRPGFWPGARFRSG